MSLLLASQYPLILTLLVLSILCISIGIVLMLSKDIDGGSVLVTGGLIALAILAVGHRIMEAILSASYN